MWNERGITKLKQCTEKKICRKRKKIKTAKVLHKIQDTLFKESTIII